MAKKIITRTTKKPDGTIEATIHSVRLKLKKFYKTNEYTEKGKYTRDNGEVVDTLQIVGTLKVDKEVEFALKRCFDTTVTSEFIDVYGLFWGKRAEIRWNWDFSKPATVIMAVSSAKLAEFTRKDGQKGWSLTCNLLDTFSVFSSNSTSEPVSQEDSTPAKSSNSSFEDFEAVLASADMDGDLPF